jgi:predicted lipoprotein
MRKVYKYTIAAAIISVVAYFSVYIENLEEVKARQRAVTFNAAEYAGDFWDNQLSGILEKAVDAKKLIELFNADMASAVKEYGKAPGVSSVYAYLLKGRGQILSVTGDGLQISVKEPQMNPDIFIETGSYIPGNAVRDASGLIDVSDFTDTMKFNEISVEINKIIVKEVIKPFLEQTPAVGSKVFFWGATQVARDATEETPFGQLLGGSAEGKEFHLVRAVPIRLELE